MSDQRTRRVFQNFAFEYECFLRLETGGDGGGGRGGGLLWWGGGRAGCCGGGEVGWVMCNNTSMTPT